MIRIALALLMLATPLMGAIIPPANIAAQLLANYFPRTNGTVFFVSTNGVSSGPGTTPATAWALSYALLNAGASNTICFLPGTNYATITLGTPSLQNGLCLISQKKWAARIVGTSALHNIEVANVVSNVVIDGLDLGPAGICCVKLDAPTPGCTVRNCWLHDAAHGRPGWVTNGTGSFSGSGILADETQGEIFEYNLIENNGAWVNHDHGIYISGTNNIIRFNVIRKNLAYGIHQFSSVDSPNQSFNNYIYGNLVYGNDTDFGLGARCIVMYQSDTGAGVGTNYVFSNLLGSTAASGEVIDAEEGGFVDATNNIFWQFSGDCVIGATGATIRNDYNLSQNPINLTGGAITGTHNVLTNNFGFWNAVIGQFYPRPDSPLRGTALNTPFLVASNNFWGQSQSSISDIGPIQYSPILLQDQRILDPSITSPDGTFVDFWNILPNDLGFYLDRIGGGGNLNSFTNPSVYGAMNVAGPISTVGLASSYNNRSTLLSSNVGTGTWSFTNTDIVNWQCFIGGAGACAVQGISVNDSQLFVGNSTNILSTINLQPNEWLRITNTTAPKFSFKRF